MVPSCCSESSGDRSGSAMAPGSCRDRSQPRQGGSEEQPRGGGGCFQAQMCGVWDLDTHMTQLNCKRRKRQNENSPSRDRRPARAAIDNKISQSESWSSGRGSGKLSDWSDRSVAEDDRHNWTCWNLAWRVFPADACVVH